MVAPKCCFHIFPPVWDAQKGLNAFRVFFKSCVQMLQQCCVVVITYMAEYLDQPGKICQSCSVSETGKVSISLSPFAPENWSRETGSDVPSRVSRTHGIPPDFRGGVHFYSLYEACHY